MDPIVFELAPGGPNVELRDSRDSAMIASGVRYPVVLAMITAIGDDASEAAINDPHRFAWGIFINGVHVGNGGFHEVVIVGEAASVIDVEGKLIVTSTIPGVAEAISVAADGYLATAAEGYSVHLKVISP